MARSKRIKFLASLTKDHHVVLDVGTDHGLVLKEAFDSGFIIEAIASDINEAPLLQAQKNLKNHPVTYIQSDGFLHIKQTFDCVIIAGMGAYLIAQILERAPESKEIKYVLQANDKTPYLRKYLLEHEFAIEDEFIIMDKHYYEIIVARRGTMSLSEADIILGPKLRYKEDSHKYFKHKAAQILKVINKTDPVRQAELEKLCKIYQNLGKID